MASCKKTQFVRNEWTVRFSIGKDCAADLIKALNQIPFETRLTRLIDIQPDSNDVTMIFAEERERPT